MASSKVLASSNSRKSDLLRRSSSGSSSTKHLSVSDRNDSCGSGSSRLSSSSTMTVDGILRNVYSSTPTTETTLVDASITLIDTPATIPDASPEGSQGQNLDFVTLIDTPGTIPDANPEGCQGQNLDFVNNNGGNVTKTVDDVWREIVSGVRKEVTMKEEAPDEIITLEEFLARNEAADDAAETKVQSERLSGGVYSFDPLAPNAFHILDKMEGSIVGLGSGAEVISGTGLRGKRGRGIMMEPLDKAAQQRQKRMIKNRESAARSRERKQAYQVELESLAVRLEEENEQLLKEKVERTKERFKQLMEKVVPVVEQRRPPRRLCRYHSF